MASKWKNRPFSSFSGLFWHAEIKRKFHRWATLSTKPAQNLSTVTFFNSLKHVLCTLSQSSFDMFSSWLRQFEFRAKICIQNQLTCLNFREPQKRQKEKRKFLPAEPLGRALPQPPGLVPPSWDFRPAPRRPPASRTCSATPEWTCSSQRWSFSPQATSSWTCSTSTSWSWINWDWGRAGEELLREAEVGSVFPKNLPAENNLLKKVKTDNFFILKPQRIFLTKLTFSPYSDKFQNLRISDLTFSMLLKTLDIKQMYPGLYCHPVCLRPDWGSS
jgi:hypothetical protein